MKSKSDLGILFTFISDIVFVRLFKNFDHNLRFLRVNLKYGVYLSRCNR
ncbi:hypothetical protein LEP1GSC125_1000 [Leptospira mayottensis 200901122]|uniref:Uncharacterized protein n=1 Tax=Leptospira mayottensis 200901122 TaxID=1193010 RepID=A0AA87ML51_9LEPT|nr:hypothetical protein LEP1GSC125_1000 [Leptospira mayottensis 200901122]